jgi:hypothetical protein
MVRAGAAAVESDAGESDAVETAAVDVDAVVGRTVGGDKRRVPTGLLH